MRQSLTTPLAAPSCWGRGAGRLEWQATRWICGRSSGSWSWMGSAMPRNLAAKLNEVGASQGCYVASMKAHMHQSTRNRFVTARTGPGADASTRCSASKAWATSLAPVASAIPEQPSTISASPSPCSVPNPRLGRRATSGVRVGAKTWAPGPIEITASQTGSQAWSSISSEPGSPRVCALRRLLAPHGFRRGHSRNGLRALRARRLPVETS